MADQPYSGSTVTIKLPVPLDPNTLDVWAGQLEKQAFVPLAAAINGIIRYLNGDTTPPVIVVPPTVAIAVPRNGATLTGTVQVIARATGLTAITTVTASLSGTRLGVLTVDSTGTWTLAGVDTARFPDGAYQLLVQAADSSGNVGSDTVTVLVSNTVPDDGGGTVTPSGDLITTEASDQLTTETGDVLTYETSTASSTDAITSESGDQLTTESGDALVHE